MKTFKRIRSTFKDNEAQALESVCKKENVTADQLSPAHTKGQFVWTLNGTSTSEEATSDYPHGLFTVDKTDDETLQGATNKAMEHFETFEGNIQRVEEKEDEEHYVFTKVR